MRLPEAFTSACTENSFLGSKVVAQTWNDLALWEEFLNRYRIRSLIELGTWSGGMAAFFGVQGLSRGFQVVTVDHNPALIECSELLGKLGVRFEAMDLLGPDGAAEMRSLLSEMAHPLMLFCDNGNKPVEFHRFAPMLTGGDYVAVHDWGSEIAESDILPGFEMLMRAESEDIASMTRFFVRSG